VRVRTDEHISPHLVAAIREIALSDGWEITSVRSVGDAGTSDVHWITRFANDGGEAILTADKDFISLEAQVNAVFATGIKVILLPKRWGSERGTMQAAHILQWWERIEAIILTMKQRECFRPEWNINETGTLKKIDIDFAKAQKQRRKNKSRNR